MTSTMFRRNPRVLLLAAAFALLALPGVSPAASLTATLDSVSSGYGFSYSNSANGANGSGLAVEQNWHITSGGGSGIPNNFKTFCVQLSQFVSFNSNYSYDIVPLENVPNTDAFGGPMATAKANSIREIFGRHYADVDTAQEFSAFQISVWEIVYEKTLPYNLNDGNFTGSSDPSVITLANSWLSGLDGEGPLANLVGLTNPTAQDHVTVASTPAPPGIILAGIGAIGFAFGGFRRRFAGSVA